MRSFSWKCTDFLHAVRRLSPLLCLILIGQFAAAQATSNTLFSPSTTTVEDLFQFDAGQDPFSDHALPPTQATSPDLEPKDFTVTPEPPEIQNEPPPPPQPKYLQPELPQVLPLGESTHGSAIASVPCDPFMSSQQEQRLFAALKLEDSANWSKFTWLTLQSHLANYAPTRLNQNALEHLGLDAEDGLGVPDDGIPSSLGAKAFTLLRKTDMTLAISQGGLLITSIDDDSSRTQLRVYDVTPLVMRIRQGTRTFDFTPLSDAIRTSIASDNWIDNGGSSTMTGLIHGPAGRERGLLTIQTTTFTHLMVQEFLNTLNVAPPGDGTANPYSILPSSQPLAPNRPLFDDRVNQGGMF